MQKKRETQISDTGYTKFILRFIESLTESRCRLSVVLVSLVSLLLYYQTFSFGFVWDDLTVALTKNQHLINPSVRSILYFWCHPESGMYIPVTYTVWSILELFNYKFLGSSFYPGTYHVTNFLIHTLNGLLVLMIVYRLLESRTAATVAAMLFIVHPLQVEVVAWTFELRMLLATFFSLCSLYLYLIYLHRDSNTVDSSTSQFPWGSLGFFALALLSKPVAVITPVFFIAVSYFIYGHTIVSAIKRVWPLLLLAMIITLITLIEQPQGRLVSQFEVPLWVRPLVWMDSINFYAMKILLPISLSTSYDRTTEQLMQQWWLYITWLVPVLMGLALWKYYKHHKQLLLGVAFFILGFLPVSGLLPFWFQYWSNVADRYIYLSMLGISIVFSYIFIILQSRAYRFVMLGFLFFCFFWSAFIQIPVWRNEHTLWDHAIQIKQENPRALYNRGVTYSHYGMWDEAVVDINESIYLDRQRKQRETTDTSSSLSSRGSEVENLTWFIMASPDYTLYLLRAYVFFKGGYLESAIQDMNSALQMNPRVIEHVFSSSASYAQLTESEKKSAILRLSAIEFGALIPDLYIYATLAQQYLANSEQVMNKNLNEAMILGGGPNDIHRDKIKKLFGKKQQ